MNKGFLICIEIRNKQYKVNLEYVKHDFTSNKHVVYDCKMKVETGYYLYSIIIIHIFYIQFVTSKSVLIHISASYQLLV
jgi:hypothetical protein